jgi:DegV family protein with EDD domain
MSRNVVILTDSTAYVPQELQKELDIRVIPLSVIWENKTFLDGVDILPDEFYRRLKKASSLPTTSQVTVGAMQEIFQKLLSEEKDVLGIFISSNLSGTVFSAMQAKELLHQEAERIVVFDSLSTTAGMNLMVLMVARAAKDGKDLKTCHEIAQMAREKTGVLFVVETLEYLRKGGRIGGAQSLIGGLLNIKPVLELRDGRIESLEKVRTKQKALQRVSDIFMERVSGKRPVRLAVAHADNELEAMSFLQSIQNRLDLEEAHIQPLSPVIGTHLGPGAVVLGYIAGM